MVNHSWNQITTSAYSNKMDIVPLRAYHSTKGKSVPKEQRKECKYFTGSYIH